MGQFAERLNYRVTGKVGGKRSHSWRHSEIVDGIAVKLLLYNLTAKALTGGQPASHPYILLPLFLLLPAAAAGFDLYTYL